jgi:hypothetical protein
MLSQSVVSGIGSSLIFTPAMSAVSFKRNQSPLQKEQSSNHVLENFSPRPGSARSGGLLVV